MNGTPDDVLVPARVTSGDDVLRVAHDERERGRLGGFYPLYRTVGERTGWFCGNCHSPDVTGDTVEHLRCLVCGNDRPQK